MASSEVKMREIEGEILLFVASKSGVTFSDIQSAFAIDRETTWRIIEILVASGITSIVNQYIKLNDTCKPLFEEIAC